MSTTPSALCIHQGLPVARNGGSNSNRSPCLLYLSSLMPYGNLATFLMTSPSITSFPFNIFESSAYPLSTLMPGRVCRSQRSGLNLVTHHISWSEPFEFLTQDIKVMPPVIQTGTDHSWIGGNRFFVSSVPYQCRHPVS